MDNNNGRICAECGEYIPMGKPFERGVCAPCAHARHAEAVAAEKRMRFTPRYCACSERGAELSATPDATAYLAGAGSHRAKRALAEAHNG